MTKENLQELLFLSRLQADELKLYQKEDIPEIKEEIFEKKTISEKKKKSVIPALMCLVVVVAGILGATFMSSTSKDNLKTTKAENASNIVENQGQVKVSATKKEEVREEESYKEEQLVCDIKTVADYSKNLDFEEYSFYQSKQNREFKFYYPSNLYNQVEFNKDVKGNSYGTILEEILFTGSDKQSEVNYQLIKRETGRTRVEDTQLLYDGYQQSIIGFQKVIFHDGADERPGRMIVIGYDQTVMNYILVQVTDESIMKMEITFPTDGNKETEDFWQKEYVVECMYRSCGFSGSSKTPQTYQQFWDSKQEALVKNDSDLTATIKTDLRKYQNMTYRQFKEMTGKEAHYWRQEVFGTNLPYTKLDIVFRASYFTMDDWYQLQEHDICHRLEGELGNLLDGIKNEMTIAELENALSKGTVAAQTEYGEGYAGAQTLSEKWAVIAFDSNQDGELDAEVHVDIMEKNTIGPETLAWLIFDCRSYSEICGW